MTQQIDYYVIAAPLTLAVAAALVLVLDAFLPARRRAVPGLVTLVGVLAALGFVVAQSLSTAAARGGAGAGGAGASGPGVGAAGASGAGAGGGGAATFCVPPGLASGERLCSFVMDGFALVFAGLVLVAAVVVVLLSMTEVAGGGIPVGEWYFLLLCTLVGAVTLPASRDLVMLVVALELVSLPVFALTALRRYDGRASEAAVKLFVVSVVSTAVMLFGVSLLYGVAGTVHLSRLGEVLGGRVRAPGADPGSYAPLLEAGHGLPAVVTVGVVLVTAGFAFKIAAVPFHFWAADVYQGAPVPVAALLSVISKAAGFAGLILVLVAALAGQAATWVPVVGVLAALTMSVGNLLAMRQRHAVRLLAWSSVAQSGYVLAALAATAPASAGHTRAATTLGPVGAALAYLVIYAAMNLGAFAVVMLVSRAAPGNELDDYRGLAFRSPAAGLALAFCLVCLAGLPPGLAGLFAKVFVFRELVGSGTGWLALVMAVNTVIGLYYYAAWAGRVFTPGPAASRSRTLPATWLAVGVALAAAILFSVAPQLVLDLTALSALG
ncbi:NADH-quinone oxidoreductase subunit N [Nonomuraea pusilla]|uniref:NADH-quinone oxidoreductase subunit N n=1 Tax=Nonomuraea pusilla TaxID=46177 RepID=A0A1H7R9N6_9ACTN|nr:NADH-quinone oxidoreductase subunit N [Nonomuraea pusilla]SEL56971.1 NADH-quinone oxidoreductase subunit N [Nonomuraea pusilla]